MVVLSVSMVVKLFIHLQNLEPLLLSPSFNEVLEYVVIGGGGAGGGPSTGGLNSYYGGGGGGGYRQGTTGVTGPSTTLVQVGAGGAKQHIALPASGTPSYFGPVITTNWWLWWDISRPRWTTICKWWTWNSSGGSYGGSITPSTGDSFPSTDTSALLQEMDGVI